jgi:hypothetical protein
VVDGVEEQPLVERIGAEIRLVEDGVGDGEAGLRVAGFAGDAAEAEEALGGDGGGGAVDRFVLVEGVGGAVEVVAELVEGRGRRYPSRECRRWGCGRCRSRRWRGRL